MQDSKLYGKHINGIPLNPPYMVGTLKQNPRGDGYPMQVRNEEGEYEQYGKWERKHFSKGIGRPRLYSDEERKVRKSEYAKKLYLKKKQAKEQWRDNIKDKIKII